LTLTKENIDIRVCLPLHFVCFVKAQRKQKLRPNQIKDSESQKASQIEEHAANKKVKSIHYGSNQNKLYKLE